MTIELERRYTPGVVEIRAAKDKRSIGGYAAKFDATSRNLGNFVEIIRAGAFNNSRGDGWPDVVARYNHDDNMLLGTISAGTLRLAVDKIGLDYTVDPPDARADVLELVQRQDVTRSSFAFRVMPEGDRWGLNDMDIPQRELLNVQLVDVAPVNVPAYADTSAAMRSLALFVQAPIDDVKALAAKAELRKFFQRTDAGGAPKQTFGPQARVDMLARRSDPWA